MKYEKDPDFGDLGQKKKKSGIFLHISFSNLRVDSTQPDSIAYL